ncbi:MAG: thioredoxin family protein [Cyclobacteriaceae bacterium]|nr:thioredoxin family protein [Cyclobacteriaceae bacterium HetDA_MAG_MS6]
MRFFSYFLLLLGSSAFGQILDPIDWSNKMSEEDVSAGSEIDLVFTATIEKDWYLYSSDFDPELGPMVTEFSFEQNDSYELVGGIEPQNPKKKYDELWEGEYTYFKGTGTFIQKVKILKDQYSIKGIYTYQVCSDVDGKCIPFEEEFVFSNQKMAPIESTISSADPVKPNQQSSLWQLAIISFLAGVAAVLMPCVYPLIPVTVSIFLKQSKTKAEGLKKALAYGVSIMLMFSFIGFAVSLIWGFSSLNALSTNWIFNLVIFSLLVLFALSFFGLFELTLPPSLVNRVDRMADRGGYLGIFFMAGTLVVVSFSCTVPIVGTAIITLTEGDVIRGTLSMFFFSLAFAIPFTAFAFFPSWLKSMPKSGGWLNTIKVVLGFLELALALKFLSVADLAYHWGILDREVFLAFWIVIFALLGFYLLGKILLPHDSPLERISVGRLMSALLVFSFVVYLIPGLFGAPLKALAGFLPPTTTHDFDITKIVRDHQGSSFIAKESLCEAPRYADKLHWPHGLQGYFDYDQALACAKEQNKPVFIDFTGHGCVNCREMEQRVWIEPQILQRLNDNFVLLALYVDDKTKLPESEWHRSTYDDRLKKTIGKKNADFQITRFNNNAQPFYIIMDPQGKLLMEPKAYDLNVSNFASFLDQGVQNFQNKTFLSSN